MSIGYFHKAYILWHLGYYDGPYSGVMTIPNTNRIIYFDIINPKHEGVNNDIKGEMTFEWWDKEYEKKYGPEDALSMDNVRYYYAYEFSDEVNTILVKQHKLFQDYVGYNTDYFGPKNRNNHIWPPNIETNWNKYTEEVAKIPLDITSLLTIKNRIGFFDSWSIWRAKQDNNFYKD